MHRLNTSAGKALRRKRRSPPSPRTDCQVCSSAACKRLLGGALLAVVGLSGLILLDVATYLASAILIWLISAPTTAAADDDPDVTAGAAVSAWANALREWAGGLRLIGRERRLAILFAVVSVATVGEGAVTVLVIISFRDVLGGGSAEFSYFVAAYGAGGIAGGLLLGLSGGIIDEARQFSLSLIANGILLVAIFNIPVLAVIVGLAVVSGVTAWAGWSRRKPYCRSGLPTATGAGCLEP
jgi:hypothetical protein